MSISYNVHGQHVGDRQKLEEHLERIRPKWLLVMDNLPYAAELARRFPDCNVIARWYPDDNPLARWPRPQDFVAFVMSEFQNAPPNLWAYTNNESGDGDDLVNWWLWLLEKTDLKLVVGNFSVGTPHQDAWKRPKMARLLAALSDARERAVLGLHEYAGGVITSGFIGGAPQFIRPEDWPRGNIKTITKWHCGRFEFAIKACAELGILPPRMVITEHGFDRTNDIGDWLDKLPRVGNDEVRSWKSLERAWAAWWPGWSHQRAYAEQLIYADTFIYANSPVEAQLIYAWSPEHPEWRPFDVSSAGELLSHLEAHARMTPAPEPPTPPPPVPTPPVLPARPKPGAYRIYFPFQTLMVRAAPRLSAQALGKLTSAARLTILPEETQFGDGYTWAHVYTEVGMGWIALLADVRFEPAKLDTLEFYPRPPRSTPTLTADDWQFVIAYLEDSARAYTRLADGARRLADIALRLAQADDPDFKFKVDGSEKG